MNSSETRHTPVRLTGLQVTDASVFEDFNSRLEAFEETLSHVQGITDAEELAARPAGVPVTGELALRLSLRPVTGFGPAQPMCGALSTRFARRYSTPRATA